MGDSIWGKQAPNPPASKMGENRQFQAKRQNIKIAISQKLSIGSTPNLRTKLRTINALRGWSNMTQMKSKMAAGRHLEKIDMTS